MNAIEVIFENALISDASEWAWVEREIGKTARTHAYNRTPTSTVESLSQDVSPQATALRLQRRGLLSDSGRYVVVGHSVGGLLAQYYASRFTRSVVGAVLVDSTHPEQFDRSSRQLNTYLWLNQVLAQRAVKSLVRSAPSNEEARSVDPLPEDVHDAALARLALSSTWLSAYRESRQASRSWSRAAVKFHKTTTLPLAIVLSEEVVVQDGKYADLQKQLASVSSNSRLEVVPGTTHESVVMDKEHSKSVSDAISWVLSEASQTAELAR